MNAQQLGSLIPTTCMEMASVYGNNSASNFVLKNYTTTGIHSVLVEAQPRKQLFGAAFFESPQVNSL